MTRQQLKNTLLAKTQVLSIAKESDAQVQPDGSSRYVVTLKVQTDTGAINYNNVAYYVENEGKAGEAAYWENAEPMVEKTPEVSFQTLVYNRIKKAVTDGHIKGGIVDKIDAFTRVAQVTAYKTDPQSASKVIVINYMVRDNAGTIELSEITN